MLMILKRNIARSLIFGLTLCLIRNHNK
jgi:hypothetical protein